MSHLKMYAELAMWWPLLSPPDHYDEESAFFVDMLREANVPSGGSMLDLGSGGGSLSFHLKSHFVVTLVDVSPEMLAVSRGVNPECEHLTGDMRTARLGRQFDGVIIHDAIDYMTTAEDLRRAFETAFVHCKPGGTALFVPDHTRETYADSSDCSGEDGDERALRCLEWTFDPDPADSTCVTHYTFVMREGNHIRVEYDQHEFGLFARGDWLRWLRDCGFEAVCQSDPYGRDVFVARKPSG
jgi:SAM-dependent methyltransferase